MSRAGLKVFCALGLVALLAACAGSGGRVAPAPVEDRTSRSQGAAASASVPSRVAPDKPMPGAENAGKPGYYTVKPGDTLIRVGLDHGQNWRDIARWSGLENPNVIEVGQVLRVIPPGASVATEGVVVRPVSQTQIAQAPAAQPQPAPPKPAAATASATSPASPPNPQAASAPAADLTADDALAFVWPAQGNLLATFDEAKNKGFDIAGKAGDPIVAAADGRVVYAGSGLRGYGNLIILKHNNIFLTAYAHNQTLLVKEDQNVKRGQKIAEMGSTDTDQVKLHFEIRRQGKPVDPAKFLPAR
jgi:lipoprotein NlpD